MLRRLWGSTVGLVALVAFCLAMATVEIGVQDDACVPVPAEPSTLFRRFTRLTGRGFPVQIRLPAV